MTEAIIRKYCADLVESLPMNDAKFRAKLYSAGLLPGNLLDEIQSKPTAADKAEHFLHHGIKNDTESFNELLTIMEDFNDNLKKLAEMICGESDLQHPILSKRKIDSELEINIVLTGVMGSGKSAACNFFFRKEVFRSEMSFSLVTMNTDFHVQMIGGKLTKFVDTPGLLDPSINSKQEFERLEEAILAVPNGIHAFGVVIRIGSRITTNDVRILEQLLDFIELIPYTFVIFSNANLLGSVAHGEQQHNFEILLNDDPPPILHKVLEAIDHRYIILESVLNKEQDYYDTKVEELMKIVQSILAEMKKPFIFSNDIARQLHQTKKRIDTSKDDIKNIKDQLKQAIDEAKKEKLQGLSFWQKFSIFTSKIVGASAIK